MTRVRSITQNNRRFAAIPRCFQAELRGQLIPGQFNGFFSHGPSYPSVSSRVFARLRSLVSKPSVYQQ